MLVAVTRVSRASRSPAFSALSAELSSPTGVEASSLRAPPRCQAGRTGPRTPWIGAGRTPMTGRRRGGPLATDSRLGPSACGCSSRRRAGKAGSAASQTPSDFRSWRVHPGAPSARRARGAAAVRCEAWGEAAAVSSAEALLWARVRGPSVAACRFMRLISSPFGSITAARQLSRRCWDEEHLVALTSCAGAARAMRGNRRRRARVSLSAPVPGPAGGGIDDHAQRVDLCP